LKQREKPWIQKREGRWQQKGAKSQDGHEEWMVKTNGEE